MRKIVFDDCKLLPEKLLERGFLRSEQGFFKDISLLDGQFSLRLLVSEDGSVCTTLTDTASEEEYILHLVEECGGAFVAQVREAFRAELNLLKTSCYFCSLFKGIQTGAIIAYIKEKYAVEPEYLWEKTPRNCIFRRKDNQKWFAAVLTVRRDRLALSGNEEEEIIDLRVEPEKMTSLLDGKRYFPGYHMNKKHWMTLLLNGSVSQEELFGFVDESYRIAKK